MPTQKTTIIGLAILATAILTFASVLAAIQSSRTFPVTGVVTAVNVSLYRDSACTQPLNTLDLGNVTPSSSTSNTIWVKNTGNTPVSLNLTVNAWNPITASNYMNFTWNQEAAILSAGNNVAAILTLTVSPSVTGINSFSLNATITGTQM